jgi:hypothetical protein
MEATTRASAVAFFANEGYAVKSLSKDGLHQAWINLQRKYHEGGQNPDPSMRLTIFLSVSHRQGTTMLMKSLTRICPWTSTPYEMGR